MLSTDIQLLLVALGMVSLLSMFFILKNYIQGEVKKRVKKEVRQILRELEINQRYRLQRYSTLGGVKK